MSIPQVKIPAKPGFYIVKPEMSIPQIKIPAQSGFYIVYAGGPMDGAICTSIRFATEQAAERFRADFTPTLYAATKVQEVA